MIDLTSEEIENLHPIGSGNFGRVYTDGSLSYKIYHDKVKTTQKEIVKNPSLRYRPLRLNRFMSLDKKLLYTDLVLDVIFIGDKFSGVVLPYYKGKNLDDLRDEPLDKKISVARELIRNSKELTCHYIYPLDYKLNNIIFDGKNAHFIDLDDCLTKVFWFYNPYYKGRCIRGLDETIKEYFNEFRGYPFRRDMQDKLNRERVVYNSSYEEISKYVDEKSRLKKYIFIKDDVLIDKNITLLRDRNYKVIYVYNDRHYSREYTENMVCAFLERGINLYDITPYIDNNGYINDFIFDECLQIEGDKILRIKR